MSVDLVKAAHAHMARPKKKCAARELPCSVLGHLEISNATTEMSCNIGRGVAISFRRDEGISILE